LARGFEDVDRADDIHHRAKPRVDAAGRHLQPGEVNNVGDLEFFNDRRKRVRFCNVAGDHCRSSDLVIVHDQTQTPWVGALIENNHTRLVRKQPLHDPRADKSMRAGNEKSGACQAQTSRLLFAHVNPPPVIPPTQLVVR
jgi:hypothetical protein